MATRDVRGKQILRRYYIKIPTAISKHADREDAIIGLPEDRIIRNFRGEIVHDYSTTDKECAAELFPLTLIFDQAKFTDWQLRYIQSNPAQVSERLLRWNEFVQGVVQPFQTYQVPLIVLRKETPKEAVCLVFEKVNTGGVPLTVFELLTATFAVEGFALRDDWEGRSKRLKKHKILQGVENTDVLQAVTLLATYSRRQKLLKTGTKLEDAPGVSCKRKDVLDLTLNDYQSWVEPITKGFEKAAKFLYSLRFFSARDLPYRTQLVPLAATFAFLGDLGDNEGAKSKIARWFWCGVFGELYGSAIETRIAKDLVDLVTWIKNNGSEPSTIYDSTFVSSRLRTLSTRNSAAYKGIYALLMLDGGLDFRTGDSITVQTYFDESIDIHHIFPKQWCSDEKIDRRRTNCIVNKTAISAKTNRIIGKNAPSVYLAKVEKSASIDPNRMDQILASHVIDPKTMRIDSFDGFFAAREKELLQRIEKAMGKPPRLEPYSAESDTDETDVDDDDSPDQ